MRAAPPSPTPRSATPRRATALLVAGALLLSGCLVGLVTASGPAVAQPASGGEGRFGDAIDWIRWEAPNNTSFTGTTSRTVAGETLTTTCTASGIDSTQSNQADAFLRPYRPGEWQGDALDELYNVGGTNAANRLVNGLANREPRAKVSFDFACSATLAGRPVALNGLVFADAEQSNSGIANQPDEYVAATPDGPATFRVIDRYRDAGCTASSVATLAGGRLELAGPVERCATGPAAVAFIDGATSARVELQGGGTSAIGLGVVISTDFGDAPASYGTAGHLAAFEFDGGEVPAGVPTRVNDPAFGLADAAPPAARFGDALDPETAPLFSPDARGDDGDGSSAFPPADDEDSLVSPSITRTPDGLATVPVSCAAPGEHVAGWIDWNVDGDFADAGERSRSATCEGGEAAVVWDVDPRSVDGLRAGRSSFLRLRTAADPDDVAEPTGIARTGEAEDHAVTLDVGPTVRLRLAVPERAVADDQLAVGLQDAGGTELFSATTSGAETSADTASRIVEAGTTYTVTTGTTAGSTGDLADYDVDITCADADGRPVAVTGPDGAWQLGPLATGDEVTCDVTADGLVADLALTKTASAPADSNDNRRVDRGDVVTYSFEVENTGDLPLTGLAFDESRFTGTGLLGEPVCPPAAETLDPAEVVTCRADYTLTQADVDAGAVDNTATVTAEAPRSLPDPVSNPSSAPVRIAPTDAVLTMRRTTTLADRDGGTAGVADRDETVDFTYVVTNGGNRTVTDVQVVDDFLGAGGVTCPTTPLGSADSVTCRAAAVHTVSDEDLYAGSVGGDATASALPAGGGPRIPSATLPASVPTARPAPAVDLAVTVARTDDRGPDAPLVEGEVLTYTYLVTNTGNVALDDVTGTSSLADVVVACATGAVEPDGLTTCTGSHTVTAAEVAAGEVRQDAGTSARPAAASSEPRVSDTDTVTTPAPAAPALWLDAVATVSDPDHAEAAELDDVITYTFTVTNTGNVPVRGVGVTGTFPGTASCTPTTLLPGASASCTTDATRTVTQDDVDAGGLVAASATATATPAVAAPGTSDPTVTATDPADVPLRAGLPLLDVTVTADDAAATADGRATAGETVAHTVVVRNTGTVTVRLGAGAVTSDTLGALTCPDLPVALLPGDRTTCAAAYPLSQDDVDAGEVTHVVDATGTDPGGDLVDDDGSARTVVTRVPGLGVELRDTLADADGDGRADRGESVTYAVVLTNTGTTTLSLLDVPDFGYGAVTCAPSTLLPGASVTCGVARTRPVTQADVDAGTALLATATATATSPGRAEPLSVSAGADTPVASPGPRLSVTGSATPRDADGDGRLDAGEVVAHTWTVLNTGDVTLDDVVLVVPGHTVTCTPTSIAPGEAATCGVVRHVVTADEVEAGEVLVTATADGTPRRGDLDAATTTVRTVIASLVTLTLDKTARLDDTDGDGAADAGERVDYAFVVTNTGNRALVAVDVDDPALGAVTCPARLLPLAPGEDVTCTASETRRVTAADVAAGEPLTNTATATGTTRGGASAGASDTAVVEVAAEARLELVKTGHHVDGDGDGGLDAGERISYAFVVTNAGTTTVGDLVVVDPLLGGVTCETRRLAPGESASCRGNAAYVVSAADARAGEVVNTATASALPAGGLAPVASPPDVVTTDGPRRGSGLRLVKRALLADRNGNGAADPGERVGYRFRIRNTGATTVTGLVLGDLMLRRAGIAVTCRATSLAAGATAVCESQGRYTVRDEDVVDGRLVNVASVAGDVVTPDGPDRVASRSTAAVPTDDDPADDAPGTLPPGGGVSGGSSGSGGLLPATGAPTAGAAVLGLVMLLGGAVLLRRARRPRGAAHRGVHRREVA